MKHSLLNLSLLRPCWLLLLGAVVLLSAHPGRGQNPPGAAARPTTVASAPAVSGAYQPDPILTQAFRAFWRGQVLRPAAYFLRAATRADSLLATRRVAEPTRRVWLAQRAIFRQFGQLLAERYESSSTLLPPDSRRAWQERLLDLDQWIATPDLPDSVQAGLLMAKGLTFNRLARDTDARNAYANALNLVPDWGYLLTALSDLSIEQGNYTEAEQLLERSYQQDSTLLLTHYLRGWVYYKTNRINEAERVARQALRADSTFYVMYNLLAGVYEQMQLREKATDQYKRLRRMNPRWVRSYTNLSNLYKDDGQFEEALREAARADTLYTAAPITFGQLAALYDAWAKDCDRRKETDRAKAFRAKQVYYLNKCVALDSALAYKLGDYYFNRFTPDAYRQARPFYQRVLQYDPNDVNANFQLGELERLTEHYQQAIPFYQRAIRGNPRYADAHAMLGECYGQLNQRMLSIAMYERVLSLEPGDTTNLYRLGYQYASVADSLLQAGQVRAAQALLEKGARLGHPQCANLAYGLRAEYDSVPNPGMAQFWYKRSALRLPFSKIAHARLLRLYEDRKIVMDSTDYKFWKSTVEHQLKKITIPCPSDYGTRSVVVYFFNDYPPGVHPLAYEKERVYLEEYKARIPDNVVESFAKLYRIAKNNDMGYHDLLVYALNPENNDKVKALTDTINAVTREVAIAAGQHRTGTYLILLDSLIRLHENRLALKKDNPTYQQETASAYLQLGKVRWQLTTDQPGLLRAVKRAVALDSTNGAAVRTLALAWLLNPQGDSLQQHYSRFETQVYKGRPFRDYFFDDLDSLRQTATTFPLLDQFYEVLNTPYQQARRGRLAVETVLAKPNPVLWQQAARGYEEAATIAAENNARLLYQRLTTDYPQDTTLAATEWSALLRINGKNPLPAADSVRLAGLYALFLQSRNPHLLQRVLTDYSLYTDLFDDLPTRLAYQTKLVLLNRRWRAVSPADEEAGTSLGEELYRQSYLQLRMGAFETALSQADEALRLVGPSWVDRCRTIVALTQVYLGRFAEAEPELKRLSSISWYSKTYSTYGEWMFKLFQLLKKTGNRPPDAPKFHHFFVEVIHDDEALYEEGLLTDADLLNGDVSQRKLWLTYHLTSEILRQTYVAETADREQVLETLFNSGQTSALLLAARTTNYRIQKKGINREEALFFARQTVALYDRIDGQFAARKGVKDTLAAGYGGLAFSFLKWGQYKEGLRLVEKAYQYNPDEDYTLTNLPLAHLLNNQFDKARALYLAIAKRPWKADERYETYREVFLTDFNDLEKAGIHHPDFNRIRALLSVKTNPKSATRL